MTAKLKKNINLTLWGHALLDYQAMFGLTEDHLEKKILDWGSGPSSFNVEMFERGNRVISCDELYGLPRNELEHDVADLFQAMLNRIEHHEEHFNWEEILSLDNFSRQRQQNINKFLSDIELGLAEKRYFPWPLNSLSFQPFEFDLALCPYYFFGNRINEDLNAHVKILTELCQLAAEVRIYPIVNVSDSISPIVGPLVLALQQANITVEIREVACHFRKNGNAMLRLLVRDCVLSNKAD